MNKLNVALSVSIIFTTVSLVYGAWIGKVTSLETPNISIGNIATFFAKSLVFAVDGVPYIFTIIWWFFAMALALSVFLLIRGD